MQWISVDEALPAMTGRYLVCVDSWPFCFVHIFHYRDGWTSPFQHLRATVTHWMPLPVLPEPAEDLAAPRD